MCFSPQGDLVGGLVITAIGVDAVRHVRDRRDHLALAALPLLLGAHQLDETFVWWGLQGHVPAAVGRVAMWAYLFVAFVVLPVYVPLAVMALEERRRKRLMAPFAAIGGVVAAVLLGAMLIGSPTATLARYHIAYSLHLDRGLGLPITVLYVVAVCGALLISRYHDVRIYGIANLVAVVILARLTADGFASLWCAYAAIVSGAIALHMRFAKTHREHPYLFT
jgi:hypothetical protein